MPKAVDITQIIGNFLRIGISSPVRLKNASGVLAVRNSADSADAGVTVGSLAASATSIDINSGVTNKLTIGSATSPTVPVVFKFPPDNGTAGFGLQTDGSGNTTWVASGSATNRIATDTTSVAFGSASSIAAFTLPVNAVVEAVRVVVDTAFNGSPSLSVGISGTTSKYLGSTQVDLTASATTVFEVYPGLAASGSSENILISYTAGGASAGAARVEVDYVVPS
jgi:hypothetical protein